MNRRKQIRFLWILPLVAVIFSLLSHANTLISLALFWGIPSLLVTIWAPRRALKAAIFALVAAVFLMLLDLTFYLTHQWYVVSMFKNHVFGVLAWEDFPYFFLFVYFPVIFWEHFHERQNREPQWSKKMTRLIFVLIFASLIFITALIWAPKLVLLPYFYLITLITVFVIPSLLELWSHPKMRLRFIHLGLYFSFVALLYELTALYLGQWYFPSENFIGWVMIRNLKFPVEELFSWIILGSTGVLSWYEYFDDDNK